MKNKRIVNEQVIIEMFGTNRGERFTQDQIEHFLYQKYGVEIPTREIRRCISKINRDRTTKFVILTDGIRGYYVPQRITSKLVKEEAMKLRKRALSELYRSSSMLKKMNLPFEDVFGNEVEKYGEID